MKPFRRTAHHLLGQLHAATLHLSDSLQAVPHIMPLRIRYHSSLGTGRMEVQRHLLRAREKMLAPGELLRMAEVGVDDAKVALSLLAVVPDLQYVGVDPYTPCAPSKDSGCWPSGEARYADALLRLHHFAGRAHILRSTSHAAAAWIKDRSLDLVWIDAFHSYKNCLEDLWDWPQTSARWIYCRA